MNFRKLNFIIILTGLILIFGSLNSQAAVALTVQEITSGLSNPIFVTFAPGDSLRLFIVEQGGEIKILKDGNLLGTSFLNIQSKVLSGGERGLLGLAFHPQYQLNGFFFVNYTDNSGNTVVSKFSVSANPDIADFSSEVIILTQAQPFSNHNGGMIAFGPNDGYLYIGFGDGGDSNDPNNNGQNMSTLLGKMVRIDIEGASPYSIPEDNPFSLATDTAREIWVSGLRNPWRFSFDRTNGNLFIADVGQNESEEIDVVTNSSNGGQNFGWRLKEASNCFIPSTNCDPTAKLTDPIYEYVHGGSPHRCSVTGGYVYRGCAIPELTGAYIFGDFCSGDIWSFQFDGEAIFDFLDLSNDLNISIFQLSSFGEDYYGEIYLTLLNDGKVFKIIPVGEPACSAPTCCGLRGDVDQTGERDIVDLTYFIDFMFAGGQEPVCMKEADNNNNGEIDITDLTYYIAYMFANGPEPIAC